MKKLFCRIFGHKYRVVQKFTGLTSLRIKCVRCGGDWGISYSAKAIIPWDLELEEMYKRFGFEIAEALYENLQSTS